MIARLVEVVSRVTTMVWYMEVATNVFGTVRVPCFRGRHAECAGYNYPPAITSHACFNESFSP